MPDQAERLPEMRSVGVVLVVALATVLHGAGWFFVHERVSPPNVVGQLASVSFSPIAAGHDGEKDVTSEEQIRSDLAVIAPYTRAIRTYSVSNGLEAVPELASEFGLHVTLGAWIDDGEEENEREIETAIELSKHHRNIDSIIVGNETLYRNSVLHRGPGVQDLIAKIQRVKRQVSVPVTTAEVWNIWLEHPELVSAVDYLAVHILPYWEGLPSSVAVDHAIKIYQRLRQAYPGKRIVIAEFGWPSAGLNRLAAVPDPVAQADIIRDFVARADAMGIDYSIVEAFDQPWKTFEGSVGAYWGIFDTDRGPKFALAGSVETPNWVLKTVAALAIGLLLCIPIFASPGVTPIQAAVFAGTAHAIGAWGSSVFDYWATHYFVLGSLIAMIVGATLLVPLVAIMKQRLDELAEIIFGGGPKRLLAPGHVVPDRRPFVSIHIPAYREPPEMLLQTLDSVAKLDWPNFECIVVINNTPEANLWRPIEEHCELLGPRFKFVREDQLKGFKAGALRLALDHTSPEAEIIGVLDADYVVHPDWLKDLVPAFATPSVGLVQAPQDHRDGDRSVVHAVMNREYAGFFDIGMVQRNEVNAIVSHGTMCLVRRSALVDAGGWSSDTIVEDADLGLTLLSRGWWNSLHAPALWLGSAAVGLRRLQAAAPPLGLWRRAAHQETLARLHPGTEPHHHAAADGVSVWLAHLARRREPWRRDCNSQSDLDAARRLSRHCRAAGGADHSRARRLLGHASAFHGALPDAGPGADVRIARRRLLGHGPAADGRPRRGGWTVQGRRAVPAHGQRLCRVRHPALPSSMGGRAWDVADPWLARPLSHQLPAGDRDLDLQRGPAGAEPALPRCRGGDPVRALLAQRLRHLAQARGSTCHLPSAPAARAPAHGGTAGERRYRHPSLGKQDLSSRLWAAFP